MVIKMPFSEQNPWIKYREPNICGWKPDFDRGFITNMNMNMSIDWYAFSSRQIREYVRMMKSFGFTGIQINDTCANWLQLGGWESVHERMSVLADALHGEGMQFTLWIWAAEFSGHGWNDPEVHYHAKDGGSAYSDPDVFRCFSRYYDIYAELAPKCDRVILHFFDPGRLRNYDDVFAFARLARDKFRAKNPDILIGMDSWGCPPDFPDMLVKAGLRDFMLMELPFLPTWNEPGKRAKFRQGVKDAGCELGVWSWYTADMEIDQNAKMVVNPKAIKYVYNKTREQGDSVTVPSYWSEMDSYHVMNVFSMYCAGQLLINPERDPDELLSEIAHKIYGDLYGDTVLRALRVIQDARCGDSWDTYWWRNASYAADNTDPYEISARAKASLAEMKTVASDRGIKTDQPLPVSPYTIANLMLPHLDQIYRYAVFRIEMRKLEKMLEDGCGKAELYARLDEIWEPIPDFNTIVGVWGQDECMRQSRRVREFCREAGIDVPKRGLRSFTVKKRAFEYIFAQSKSANGAEIIGRPYEKIAFDDSEWNEIFASLEEEGVIERLENGAVRLCDTHNYDYNFTPDGYVGE